MSQPDEITPHAPISGSWNQDWENAKAAAEAREGGSQEDSDGNASEQEGQQSADEGPNHDGTQDPEAGGEEGGVEAASEAEGGEGESDKRPEGGQREEVRMRPKRGASQSRGERRADGKPSQEGSVESEEDEPTGPVTVEERVKFREERRDLRAKFQQREQELQEKYDRAVTSLEDRYEQAQSLQKALDGGDYDEIARAAGYDDFGAMSVAAVQRSMSPDQQEMIKLRRELQAEKREREKYAERQRQQRESQQQAQYVQEYKYELKDELQTLDDETVASFATEDSFVDMVFSMQQRHWDGKETISAADAAELVMGELRPAYERMHSVFGGRAASQPEKQPASGAIAEKPRRKPPTTVSQAEATDASGNDDSTELDNDAWARKWGPRLANSTAVS